MGNKIIKNAAILTGITLIAGLLLGAVQGITEKPIANAQEKAKQEAYKQVFSSADSFEDYEGFDEKEAAETVKNIEGTIINEAVVAKESGKETGYVITATDKNGYGGDIQVSVGIKNDGTVNGIAILKINETAGLGMKAQEPEFYNQFRDKKVENFEVTESGASTDNQIDALSGATITSNAVTGAVNAALTYYQTIGGGGNE